MGLPKDYEHHTAIVATGSKLMFFVLKNFLFMAIKRKSLVYKFLLRSLDATILFVFVVSGLCVVQIDGFMDHILCSKCSGKWAFNDV